MQTSWFAYLAIKINELIDQKYAVWKYLLCIDYKQIHPVAMVISELLKIYQSEPPHTCAYVSSDILFYNNTPIK